MRSQLGLKLLQSFERGLIIQIFNISDPHLGTTVFQSFQLVFNFAGLIFQIFVK